MDSLSRVAVHAFIRKVAAVLAVVVLGGLASWCSEAQAVGTVGAPSSGPGYTYGPLNSVSGGGCASYSGQTTGFADLTAMAVAGATRQSYCYNFNTAYANNWYFTATSSKTPPTLTHTGSATISMFMCAGTPCPGVGGQSYSGTATSATIVSCPSNATDVGGVCTCNSGYAPNAGATACESIAGTCATILAGANALGGSYSFTANVSAPGGTQFCSGGCSIDATTGGFRKDGSQWVGTFLGPFTASTTPCTEATPVPAATQACPAGQVSGTVNGSTVCVPATATADKVSTAASAPAGQASAPSAVSTPDGTEVAIPPGGSVTRTTNCDAGGCTTTTTVKNSAGATTGKFDDTKPKDSFCKENPETTICKASTFSSTCAGAGATQACDGDAIQCAIAKDQLLRHCQLFDQTGATKTIGDDAMARGDTRASDHPGAAANITTVAMGSSTFDQTDLIGNTCPSDQTVAVGSGSIVMPWSQLCTPAQWLGTILVGITALACVFIAFKQG
jgi:hypothetical protein